MTEPAADRRPHSYPAPEFPPRKPKLFARTPPAIFPSILGLLGLGLAARKGAEVLGVDQSPLGGLVEAALGGMMILWLLAIIALLGKILRRVGVLIEDLRALPGRAGLSAATMSGMAAATVLVPYSPRLALGLAVAALVLHGVMAVILIVTLARLAPEARSVSPVFHLAFVAFILGALPLAQLGALAAATAIFWATLAVASAIWTISLWQLMRTSPPAPLRPLLAIHLAPAALLSLVAGQIGLPMLAFGFAAVGMVMFLALLAALRWITVAGFSPLWGAFTFPLTALAGALLTLGGTWEWPGLFLLVLALGIVPAIAWNVLKLWPGNRLAMKTNAAEA
jgi:tellurite resistance protein